MCEQKLINIKEIETELIEISMYIYVLETALANPDQKTSDTSPYADMVKIIGKKLQKVTDILFN